jgi:hypothetical protein
MTVHTIKYIWILRKSARVQDGDCKCSINDLKYDGSVVEDDELSREVTS